MDTCMEVIMFKTRLSEGMIHRGDRGDQGGNRCRRKAAARAGKRACEDAFVPRPLLQRRCPLEVVALTWTDGFHDTAMKAHFDLRVGKPIG